jgi:hypothetical protein
VVRTSSTRSVSLCAALLLALGAPALAGGLEPGQAGGDFEIRTPEGATHSLSGLLEGEETTAVVVVVTSYSCPFSKRADAELITLVRAYGERGVRFVAVYPNERETWEGVRAHARKTGLEHLLLLLDADGAVARAYGAGVTPTFFLFDRTGVLRYRGNNAVLAGETVPVPKTDPVGCTIEWPSPKPDTGPAREGPEISESAKAWLDRLVRALESADGLVVRSARAGILAFGHGALPLLRRARGAAGGEVAEVIGRTIEKIEKTPRRVERGRTGIQGGPMRSMLDLQKRLLAEIDLSEEQKAELDRHFPAWEAKEAEFRRLRGRGDREAARRIYLELTKEAREKIDEVLTPEQRAELEKLRKGMMRRTPRRRDAREGRKPR